MFRGDPQTFETVKDWTPLPAAQNVWVCITAEDNDIPDDHTEAEFRKVSIRARSGEDEATAEYNYCVVPGP